MAAAEKQRSSGRRQVLVVDDHQAFADAISLAIDVQPDLACCATVGTAEAALEVVAASCPDVVLLDIGLPGMTGIEAIAELLAVCPRMRLLVLTAVTTPGMLIAAAEAGADGFLPKELPFAEVLNAVRSDDVLRLDRTTVVSVLRAAGQEPALHGSEQPNLTDQEYRILILIAEAATVKEIAHQLGISVHTCRGHVRAILTKLNSHSQLQAVVTAARHGMLPNLWASNG